MTSMKNIFVVGLEGKTHNIHILDHEFAVSIYLQLTSENIV